MHRLPKFLAYSSDRRKADNMRFGSGDGGSSSGWSRHGGKRKPRLDRRDARKDINYNYEYSASSASTSSSSSCYSTTEESQRARSLDLYCGKTSFRIEGMDGEVEIMCKNLGFEGIDDFGIAPEEYQAMKVRSSSAPVVLSQTIEELVEISGDGGGGGGEVVDLPNREIEENDEFVRYLDRSGEVTRRNSEEIPNYGNIDRGRGSVFGNRFVDSVRVSDVISSDHVSGKSSESRGGGIKGVRPPGLTPPPSMSLPVIDKNISTWDIFRAFGPDNDTSNSRSETKSSLDDDEEGVRGRNEDGDQEDGRRRGMVPEENGVLSGSCSFTTNSNDDDSSSTTTDPVSSISPIVRFRRVTSWQKGQLLGRGSFGSVYEGIADDGFFFAVKEVSLLDQGDEGKQRILQLEQEIALLSQFQHENIVQYYGTATDESHLYIFLELVNQGSLFSLYQKYILKDSAVSGYTRQILLGLKYLHSRNVVHRDIKCANILVDTNGSVKLADFGLAKATKLNDVKSSKGTAFWMAPEVVRSQGYGLPADIWSLGCTVLEMLTRRFPYGNLECMQAVFRIGRGEKPPIPDSLSSDARDFMRRCLQVDPSLRPTAAQLLDHPFVKRPLPLSLGFTSPPSSARQI